MTGSSASLHNSSTADHCNKDEFGDGWYMVSSPNSLLLCPFLRPSLPHLAPDRHCLWHWRKRNLRCHLAAGDLLVVQSPRSISCVHCIADCVVPMQDARTILYREIVHQPAAWIPPDNCFRDKGAPILMEITSLIPDFGDRAAHLQKTKLGFFLKVSISFLDVNLSWRYMLLGYAL